MSPAATISRPSAPSPAPDTTRMGPPDRAAPCQLTGRLGAPPCASGGSARMQASSVLAEAGAADEATALALAVAGEHPGYAHVHLAAVACGWRPTAICRRRPGSPPRPSLPRHACAAARQVHYNATIRELDKRAGQLKAHAITTAGNAGRRSWISRGMPPTGRTRCRRQPVTAGTPGGRAAGEIAAQPPWPTHADRRQLWWPAAEYDGRYATSRT